MEFDENAEAIDVRPTKMKVSLRTLIGNAQALRKEIPDKVKMLCH